MQETHWSAVKQRGLESPRFGGAQKHEFVDVAWGCSQADTFHQAVRSDNEVNHRKARFISAVDGSAGNAG